MQVNVTIKNKRNCSFYCVESGTVVSVDLTAYIAGVVASEIGNSEIEACKAQAVAARTMVYPYCIQGKAVSDSSSEFQCFYAEKADEKLYPNAFRASEETKDEVLTYRGNVIEPCSYSSSNGGRTVSSKDRWGTAKPWLIEQIDPWDLRATGGKRGGHGVGMSQQGALYAASIGKTYRDILAFYYPTTELQSKGVDAMAYAVINASWLIDQFKTMVIPGKEWKYVASGASYGAVDCSGAFSYWYKLGGSYMYHGSNTIWRSYTKEKGKIGEIDLVPGMAVFKRRDWRSNDSGNRYYNDSIGNYYHMGLYIGDGDVIEAKGEKYGCVISNVSEWGYAAKLTNTNYDVSGESVDQTIDAPCVDGYVKTSGGILFLRSKPSTSASYLKKIPNGTKLSVSVYNDAWYQTSYDGASGYVSSKFISTSSKEYSVIGTSLSIDQCNQIVEYAKSIGVSMRIEEEG